MDKSKVIWGSICLALAVLLAVLTVVLPEGKISFMIDGKNVPIAPVIILGVIGLLLLLTARTGEKPKVKPEIILDKNKATLNKRLEMVGWGFFLIMLGGFSLVPDETIPKGTWSIGVGVIMLSLNVTRYFNKIKMSGFTTALGIICLISGITQLMGVHALEGAILIIILGAYLLIKPTFDKQQVFGKAEES